MSTTTTVQAVKMGDWVLPISVDGVTVYALQINKSKDDKANIDTILAEYATAKITVYEYSGKNDNAVLLVKATEKIKATRSSANTESLVASAVQMFGCTEAMAREMVYNAKAKK